MDTSSRPSPPPSVPRLESFAALSVYLGFTLLALRPILQLGASHIAPDPYDPVFNLTLLEWGISRWKVGLAGFWNAPFFFPSHGATAFSDHLLELSAAGTILRAFGFGPAAIYNTLLVAALTLSAWTAGYVLRRLGIGFFPALLGGAIYSFAPFRWDQASHLQILWAPWVPLVLWSFDRLLERPSARRAAPFLAFYALHLLGGSYLAYMIHFPLAAIRFVRWRAQRAEFSPASPRRPRPALLVAAALCAAMMAAIFFPYLRAARSQGFERKTRHIREFAARPASFVTPSAFGLYAGKFRPEWRRPENSLFPGFVASGLALTAAGAAIRRRRRGERGSSSIAERAIVASGAVALAMCFKLPFVTLAHVLPGLSGMRVPTRFYIFALFALGLLAARSLEALTAHLRSPRGRHAFSGLVAIALLAESVPKPWPWFELPNSETLAPVYRVVAAKRVAALLELPFERPIDEIAKMYAATFHHRPLFNGYSGFIPPRFQSFRGHCCDPIPSPSDLDDLRALGITHVLVHTDRLPRRWQRREVQRWPRSGQVRRLYADSASQLFEILPRSNPVLRTERSSKDPFLMETTSPPRAELRSPDAFKPEDGRDADRRRRSPSPRPHGDGDRRADPFPPLGAREPR